MTSYSRIKGFADQYGPEARTLQRMEAVARGIFARFGYNELRTPILEKTELFCRGIGDETDVVQKEMYTFPDRKGRSLTLRPEATAGVMRAYIENGFPAREQVSRLFTIGPMFRYERPQKGRLRQFHQINAECLGPQEPLADAETVLMLMAFFRELGVDKLRLELNSLGCRDCRPTYHAALGEFFAALDQQALCEDCRRRVRTNPLRVLDCKVPACKALVEGAPRMDQHLCSGCVDHFAAVRELLDASGQAYVLNPRLVRGLDYYTRTTFEVVSEHIGAQSSVAGGGRYDGLVKQLGGPDTPGIGFAIGMERLLPLVPEDDTPRLDFYLALLDPAALLPGLALTTGLRERGLRGEMSPGARSLKAQLRQADKSGAPWCLILGESELAAGQVQVKPLRGGEQRNFPLNDMHALSGHLLQQENR